MGCMPYNDHTEGGRQRPERGILWHPVRSLLRRSIVVLAVALAAAAPPPRPARAEDSGPAAAPAALSLERIYGGPGRGGESFTGPLLDGAGWRPGRDEWTLWKPRGKDDRELVAVKAPGDNEDRLLAVSEFDPWLKAKDLPPEVGMRGIGRSGPSALLWAPDGDAAFLALRGDVYFADLRSGKRARLTQTTSPISDVRVAPNGRRVSFCRDHDLWAVDVATAGAKGAKEVRLTTGGTETLRNGDLDWVYPEELDCRTAAWWSPDSTRVAFLQLDESKVSRFPIGDATPRAGAVRWMQYPKAGDPNPVPKVGVVGLDGKPPVWLDLGPSTDVYVPWAAWHPDGKRVFVAVLDRSQTKFELRLCDADGRAAKAFLHEEDRRWVDVPPPPRFLEKRPAFLWRSRRDGWWRHWLVPLDAPEKARALTPAGAEAGRVLAVDESAGAVFYAAPGEDLLRDAVWRASIHDGKGDGKSDGKGDGKGATAAPVRVTDDAASHDASFSETGRFFHDTESTAVVPPRVTLRRADGKAIRVLADSATPTLAALRLRPPEFVRVPGAGGQDLPAMLWKPRDFDASKRYPAIVHTYGGPGARLVNDEWGGQGTLLSALLCQEGFLVFTLDNRGSGGRGKDFEAQVHRRLGALEVEDQVRGAAWLGSRPFVDPARIGIWGWSYGGYMTALAMTKAPAAFRAGVAVAPVTHWSLYDTIYTERYMDLPAENEAGYRDSAPLTFAKDLKGALLVCHGLCDDNVHVQNTLQFVDALMAAHRPFDVMLYPHRAHGIEGGSAHADLFARLLAHFRRFL